MDGSCGEDPGEASVLIFSFNYSPLFLGMGEIACVYKVMPEDSETDLEPIKDELRDRLDVDDIGEEEVAFGLKAIKVSLVTTDEEGGTDAVEEELEKLENVQSYELEHFDKL